MNSETRKRLWVAVYGLTSFEHAQTTCQQLLEICPQNTHPLFRPLSTAVHVYYARAFHNSDGIDRSLIFQRSDIPAVFLGMHDFLYTFRNKLFAHVDAATSKEFGFNVHDVAMEIVPGDIKLSAATPLARLEAYRGACQVIEYMKTRAMIQIGKLLDENRVHIPSEHGEYILSLTGSEPFYKK